MARGDRLDILSRILGSIGTGLETYGQGQLNKFFQDRDLETQEKRLALLERQIANQEAGTQASIEANRVNQARLQREADNELFERGMQFGETPEGRAIAARFIGQAGEGQAGLNTALDATRQARVEGVIADAQRFLASQAGTPEDIATTQFERLAGPGRIVTEEGRQALAGTRLGTPTAETQEIIKERERAEAAEQRAQTATDLAVEAGERAATEATRAAEMHPLEMERMQALIDQSVANTALTEAQIDKIALELEGGGETFDPVDAARVLEFAETARDQAEKEVGDFLGTDPDVEQLKEFLDFVGVSEEEAREMGILFTDEGYVWNADAFRQGPAVNTLIDRLQNEILADTFSITPIMDGEEVVMSAIDQVDEMLAKMGAIATGQPAESIEDQRARLRERVGGGGGS